MIIKNISDVFFRHANFEIITLPAGQNIYMLWKKLKEDEFFTDISEYPQFRDYTFQIWEEIIDIFGMRVSCLMNRKNVIDYDSYINEITPYELYCIEKCEIERGRVFTLSAFPKFLLDYHGVRLWNSCVKHIRNKLHEVDCSKRLYVN